MSAKMSIVQIKFRVFMRITLKRRFFAYIKTHININIFVYKDDGDERWRKKVENGIDFLKKLPRKEVEVPGLAFHVVIIGRLVLKRVAKMNKP